MQSSQQGQKQEVDSQSGFENKQTESEIRRIADIFVRDDKNSSRINLVVGILGVSILLLGVGGSFLGLTTIGFVGVAGGTITSAFSILVLGPSRNKNKRTERYYDDLIERGKFDRAIELAESLPGEARERTIEKIIEWYVQPKDREVPGLPEGRQTSE
jgi:hypothetical protein